MLRRTLLLAALTAAVTVSPSIAAPKPQVTDPKGDAVGNQAGADLVSVLYSTTGTGSGRGYVPKKLVVTMTLAGPVITQPGLTYEVSAETSTCGVVTFSSQNGSPYTQVTGLNGWAEWGDCTVPGSDGPTSVELLTVAVKGSTLTWSFPIKSLPKELKVGTAFSAFQARIDPSNPAIPFPSSLTNTGNGLVDVATGNVTWKLR